MNDAQERAFEQFVAESGDSLLRLATLLMSDPGLGEDVYQETLHRLAARWSRVDNPQAFCRRVMHNIVIDQARARQRRPPEVRLAGAHDDGDLRAADTASAVEIRPVLLAALRALTPQQRAIVVLRYFDDMVFEQAADMLWEPHLSPGLRSALYKVLAATPGMKVEVGAKDSSGRPATLISRPADSGGYTVKTYENPDTGATLESAWAGPGATFDEDLYLHIGYANAIPPNPYQG